MAIYLMIAKGSFTTSITTARGIPQGRVLELLLFTTYIFIVFIACLKLLKSRLLNIPLSVSIKQII